MHINKFRNVTTVFLFGIFLKVIFQSAHAVTPAQIPLNIGVSSAKPNIMLMIDNSGSMSDTTTITDTIAPNILTGSSTSCSSGNVYSGVSGAATAAAATTVITMQVFSNKAKFCPLTGTCTSSNSISFGNSSPKKCFNTTKYYNISGLGTYRGNQLNLYFNTYNTKFNGSINVVNPTTTSRLQVVQDASNTFVNSLIPPSGEQPTVRLGLARYNNDAGGELLTGIGDLDATLAGTITTKIAGFTASGWTPLAETLSDIGRYFTTGGSGNLTLHPAAATPNTASIATIFNSHSILNSTGSTTIDPPIQGACQKSSVIVLSDGLPTQDIAISSSLQDYDGDCSGSNSSNCSNGHDKKNLYTYPGSNSSDYLDDVAQALYEMDLRPDLAKTNGQKNNLITYTVGFKDTDIDPSTAGNNPLIKDAARQGGGKFYYTENTTDLADALSNIAADITSKISSSSSVVANTAKLDTGAAIFQAKFASADWTGSLSYLPLGASEDINGNGRLDTEDTNHDLTLQTSEDVNGNNVLDTEDTNHNGVLDGGVIGTAGWDAATRIPAYGSSPGRNIFTYNPTATTKGVSFTCANLSASQKSDLGISNCSSTTDQGVWLLNYIKGDWSHEEINLSRTDADTIRSTTESDRVFRNRTHLDSTLSKMDPDPWLLGDIVNSNPIYVSNENYGYDKLSTTAGGGSTYKNFVTSNASRTKVIYVGANDGMLHGFNASTTGTDAGKEVFAYIPNAVYGKFTDLASPGYSHQYMVDGSPRVADAYFNSAWHTLLVGTLGAGGKALFGLDVTSPSSFSGSNVLWEISSTDSPTSTDLSTDTTSLRGFAQNLGYTLSQASIVKMKDGSWAAVVANGYDSTNNLAVLYIINAQTGSIIRAIDTKAGSSTTPNGLSTPITVDIDGDRIVDAIYAGDLLGNMWKFDVNNTDTSQWKVAYGTSTTPEPLYVACTDTTSTTTCNATRQPITAKPQVSGVGTHQSTGVMVFFGTGKYFEEVDKSVANAQTQTFFGIWDNNAAVAKADLQAQSITQTVTSGGVSLRVSTSNTVNYPTKKGWYMNLPTSGERSVSSSLVRNGRIIFTTLIPIPPSTANICGVGSDATSWLTELDAINGSPLPATASGAPWDITGDGVIDASDLLVLNNQTYSPSAIQIDGGAGTPAVVVDGKREFKYLSIIKDAGLTKIDENIPPITPGSRQSWRQVLQ